MIIFLCMISIGLALAEEELVGYSTSWISLDGTNTEVSGIVLLSNFHSDGHISARGILQFDLGVVDPNSFSLEAHVHDESCAFAGGKHWKFDEGSSDSSVRNEFHWEMEKLYHSQGNFWAADEVNARVHFKGFPRSVVVHQAAGNKLLCADLIIVDPKFEGKGLLLLRESLSVKSPFPSLDGSHEAIGYSSIWSCESFTLSFLSFFIYPGITKPEPFAAHLHSGACSENGGPHWKKDPSSSISDQTNEIHWTFAKSEHDSAYLWTHASRSLKFSVASHDLEVNSVVVHNSDSSKSVCLDLPSTDSDTQSESLVAFSDTWTSIDSEHSVLSGSVVLSRTASTSRGVIFAEIFPPSTEGLVAHVHDSPCSSGGGGSHWKFDKSSSDSTEMNEFHWELQSSGNGRAWSSDNLNRNFAFSDTIVSVVIHQLSGKKLVCADLQLVLDSTNPFSLQFSTGLKRFSSIDQVHSAKGIASVWSNSVDTISILSFSISPPIPGAQNLDAHIHKDSCSNGGGGHWRFNPENDASDTSNEFHYSAKGQAASIDERFTFHDIERNNNFAIYSTDELVQSIVVHNLDGSKSVCINLEPCSNCRETVPNFIVDSSAMIIEDWGTGGQFEILFTFSQSISSNNRVELRVPLSNALKGSEFYSWTYPKSVDVLEIRSSADGVEFEFTPSGKDRRWIVLYMNIYKPYEKQGSLEVQDLGQWSMNQFK